MMVLLEVDPNLVRPGWTPLVVTVLLGVALFFLGRSLIKQFGKIHVPADHEAAASAPGAADGGPSAPEERTVHHGRGNPPIPDLRARPTDPSGTGNPPDRS